MYRRVLSGILIVLMVFQLCAERVCASGTTSLSYKTEDKTELGAEAKEGATSELEVETESKTKKEFETKTESQTENESETEAETEFQTENESETEAKTESQMETEAESQMQIETETETGTDDNPPLSQAGGNEVEAFEEGDPDCLFQAGGYRVLNEEECYKSGISLFSTGDIDALAETMYTALKERATSIPIAEYQFYWDDTEDRKQLLGIYYAVVNDHPDLYYARTGYGVSYNKTSKLITKISPQYYQNIDEEAFYTEVQKAKSIITEDMDDLQIAVAIHEYIVLNCEYDKERLADKTIPKESYSAYGVLVNHIAVCQGYALAYKYLMNEFGIECYIVTSDTMNHAWNLVAVDGMLYQLDATWDDPAWDKYGLVRHSYLLQSDEEFQKSAANHSRHYDWYVTKGSGIIDIQADGTKYDNAFWRDVYSPLLYDSEDTQKYYYISKDKTLESRTYGPDGMSATAEQLAMADTIYSGLALEHTRLYYNNTRNISYIDLDSDQPYTAQVRFALPKEDTDNIYGFIKKEDRIQYVKRAGYALSERSTIYVLDDSNQTEGEVYTVIFKDQFGTVFDRQMIAAGGYAIPPDKKITPPEGYTFSYWKGRYSNIVQDETVMAVYTKISYQIGYVLNGGINSSKNVVNYDVETDTFVLEPPTRVSYDFAGWYTEPEYKTAVGAIVKGSTGDRMFYAKWTPAVYQIQYELQGGINHLENPLEYHIEMEDILLKEPIREHYNFMGWYADAAYLNRVGMIAKGSSGNRILYAKWQPKIYQITYVLNGGINSADNPTAYQTGSDDIVLQEPKREGFAFAGWYADAAYQIKVDSIANGSGGDCIFYAKWDRYYQVSFLDKDDKLFTKMLVKEGGSVVPPEIAAPVGYEWAGWDHGCNNIQENLTIRPVYRPISYTITYVLEYGTNVAANPEEYTIETETFVLEAPKYNNPDLTFLGWYCDPKGQKRITSIEKGSMGNITLYAKWEGIWAYWEECEQRYTGNTVTFGQVTVYSGLEPLRPGLDYTINYKNNINAANEKAEKAPAIIVAGKGNYTGNYTRTFTIHPVDISQSDAVKIEKMAVSLQEKGKQKPIPTVLWNNTKLVYNKDFIVSYPEEPAQVGEYCVIVAGKGNFTGTVETTLTITDNTECVAMRSVKVAKKIPDQKLVEGVAEIQEELITLKYKGERLEPNVDYVFDTAQYYGAGTHYVTIRGIGEKYIGELVATFRVQGTKVSALKVDSVVYTGSAVKPIIRDKNGRQLTEGKDYIMHSLTGTESVGTAKITISGKNAYYGTTVKSFRVTPYAIDNADVSIVFAKEGDTQPYGKNGAKPKVIVTYAGRQLKEGTDYVLSYQNNKKIGAAATVTITGKKNFKAKRILSFIVGKGNLADTTVTVADKVASTKVGGYVSTPVLKDANGSKLAAGKDYDKNIIYKCDGMVLDKKADRLLAGAEVTVEITGKGNYAGTKTTASYRILAAGKDLSKAKVTVKSKFYYNGGSVTASQEDFIVKVGKLTLPPDTYRILPETYLNNDRKGTAQVTIQGVGSYGGTKVIRFKINARKIKREE